MKFLSLCLFVVVVFTVTEVRCNTVAEKYSVGTKIKSIRSSPKCTTAGRQCTDDCSALMLCSLFSDDPLQLTPCASPNKYCVNGACTSKPGPNCPVSGGSSDPTCSDAGIFPDAADCTQYRICNDIGTSDVYQCSAGFVFNSQLKICQSGRTPCTKINCAKATDANPFMLYTSNPAYYAFCKKNGRGTFDAIMFKCPNEQFEAFDLKAKECKFKCKARGNFQNPAECREYYYCSGNNAQPQLSKCPENWVFDGTGCSPDAGKCQFTTTTTTTPDPLSASNPAGQPEIDLINALTTEILKKICDDAQGSKNPITDPNICPTTPGTPPAAKLVANSFKTDNKNADYIFISVTIENENMFYHVRIFKDSGSVPPDPAFKNVVEVEDGNEEIVYFD